MKLIFLFLNLIALSSQAAPLPGMGSSALSEKISQTAFRQHGFSMDLKLSEWVFENNLNNHQSHYRFRALENNGHLSIRVENLKTKSNLEDYAKKWLRDFPNYGFEVLTSKNIKIAGADALLIDLAQKENQKQIRQLVLLKEEKVIVLTCHSDFKNFKATAADCGKSFSSFRWL